VNVEPDGYVKRGDTITVSCKLQYAGPSPLSEEQEPTLELTLDNEPDFPTGQPYYQPRVDTDNLHRKTSVDLIVRQITFCLSGS